MLTVNFQHIKTMPGDLVLDLGCGEGRHSIGAAYHLPQVTVISVDLNLADLSTAKNKDCDFFGSQKCVYLNADGIQLPFKEHTFDHIICSEVLEHIPDYHAMLKEIYRILKPKGSLTVSVPRSWPEKICWWLSEAYHKVEGGHVRIFEENTLRDQVTKLGFTYRRQHWNHALHTPYWWLRCLFWEKGNSHFLVKGYHSFLVWDLMKKPKSTQFLEKMLNPFIGKSIVLYFSKKH